ncbi:circadian clock-controlled protein daywake-like [Cataglyphis hispanica]|uniref:circadian clock-controlled protein daywake-like n=1 Tax=Cataglyphis hispanica TaxID=1086592 RepID=UPI0021800A6A|nr:circadian clock-controlled protein daywake-like [Cataglyphis hispanica]
MIFYALTFSILCVATFVLCEAEELTLPVTTCKRNLTDYSTCLKEAVEEAWPRFVEGLPEFDFPRLDPILYKDGRIVFNRSLIYAEGNVINATVFGFGLSHFLDVRSHFLDDVFRLEMDILMPKIIIYSYVDGQSNLFGMRTNGRGQLNVTLNENRITHDIIGHVENDTWTVKHHRIIMTVEKMKCHLSGFFDDSKELNDILEDFINEYWPPLYREFAPAVFELIDPFLVNLDNRLFSKVSFSKVFP